MPVHKFKRKGGWFIKCVSKNYAENLNISNLHDNVLLWCKGVGCGGGFTEGVI